MISEIELDAQGRFVRLMPADNMPTSVLSGALRYKSDGALTPKEADGSAYTVNTMQPAYQPSGNSPAADGDTRYADPAAPTTLPPQTLATIGDRLDAKGVSWAWYARRMGAGERRHAVRRRASIIYRGKVQLPAAPPAVQLLRRTSTRCATAIGAARTCSTSTRVSSPMPTPASCRR